MTDQLQHSMVGLSHSPTNDQCVGPSVTVTVQFALRDVCEGIADKAWRLPRRGLLAPAAFTRFALHSQRAMHTYALSAIADTSSMLGCSLPCRRPEVCVKHHMCLWHIV